MTGVMEVGKAFVSCKRSTGGAFLKGQDYKAEKIDETWFVRGVDGFDYECQVTEGGNLHHKAGADDFFFEIEAAFTK